MVRKFILDSVEKVGEKEKMMISDEVRQYNKDDYEVDKYIPVIYQNERQEKEIKLMR